MPHANDRWPGKDFFAVSEKGISSNESKIQVVGSRVPFTHGPEFHDLTYILVS